MIHIFKAVAVFSVISFLIGVSLIPTLQSDEPPVGTTIFVDDNADSSWYDATHVKTIQEGIENASSGDIVYVYNGTYNEHLVINKALVLIGEKGNEPIIDSNFTTIQILAHNVTISGFKIRQSEGSDPGGHAISINAHNCSIFNNTLSVFSDGSGITITGSNNKIVNSKPPTPNNIQNISFSPQ